MKAQTIGQSATLNGAEGYAAPILRLIWKERLVMLYEHGKTQNISSGKLINGLGGCMRHSHETSLMRRRCFLRVVYYMKQKRFKNWRRNTEKPCFEKVRIR